MQLSDWIGTLGVLAILLAYFLSTFKMLSAQSVTFYLLNTIGAAMACTASLIIHYWPFVVLEGTWTLVSLIALIRIFRR